MVGGFFPGAFGLVDPEAVAAFRQRGIAQGRRHPDMIQPPAPVGGPVILRAIAPPSIDFFRFRNDFPGDIDEIAYRQNGVQRRNLARRVRDDFQKLFV